MYEIEKFIKENADWENILTMAPYNIKVKHDGNYFMLNYDQLKSDFSSVLVQQSRGIIFRADTLEPVCVPFFKFFNFSEPNAAEIDWSTAFVSEKIDGSLIKVWYDAGSWHISTNGTIDAFKAELNDIKMPNFGEYFIRALAEYYDTIETVFDAFHRLTAILAPDFTYMFELVGPYNRVVIPYDEPAIYFLGARNKLTGEEFNCSSAMAGALEMGKFKLPKQYPFNSFEHCVKIAESFPWDAEGFVVCDAQFNRVKIKSPAYVMAHYARNNNVINRKHLLQVILSGEIEEFLCYAEDYREELEKIQGLMKAFCKVGDQFAKSCQRLYDIPRAVYANWVKTLPKIYQDLAFRNYNNVMSTKDYTAGWNENKWETYLESFEKFKKDLFVEEQ